MKEMQEIETVLRSWNLRRPSPALEERIFGIERRAKERAARTTEFQSTTPPFAFRWLVPATAGLLLLCLLANPRGSQELSGSTNSRPMVAMILSNQSVIPYLPGSFKADENNVPADSFEWTNVSGSTSSIRSLSPPRGNN